MPYKFTEHSEFLKRLVAELRRAREGAASPAPADPCPPREGCTSLGVVLVEEDCFCVYDCGSAVLFTECA